MTSPYRKAAVTERTTTTARIQPLSVELSLFLVGLFYVFVAAR